jgi:putative transposase
LQKNHIYDGHAAKQVLSALSSIVNTVRKIWADGGYKGKAFIDWCKEKFNCVIEVVKKKKKKGFHVLPRRWVVERTFAWLNRYRRLSKDYERKPTSSQSHVYVASIRLMLRRIVKERAKKLAENARKLAERIALLLATDPVEA